MYGGRKSQASRSLDQGWKALAFVTLLHRPKVVCGFGTLRAMAADGVRTGGDPELAWREGAAIWDPWDPWVGGSETLVNQNVVLVICSWTPWPPAGFQHESVAWAMCSGFGPASSEKGLPADLMWQLLPCWSSLGRFRIRGSEFLRPL